MRRDRMLRVCSVALLFFVFTAPLAAQGLDYIKENYTKQELYISMRDGVRLFTAIYAPKDASQKYPILLIRTPYSIGPYGSDRYRENVGPSASFGKEGYIVVYQDVRGRWMSEGEFEHMRPHKDVKSGPKDFDESTDTWDTIDWLVKHVSNNNGRVGMWGISYPGFYVAAGMIDAHPALKAVSPQAPVADWFTTDDWHHNGSRTPSVGSWVRVGRSHSRPRFIPARLSIAARMTDTTSICGSAPRKTPTKNISTTRLRSGTR